MLHLTSLLLVGQKEGHPACKNLNVCGGDWSADENSAHSRVLGCTTATSFIPLSMLKSRMVCPSGTSLPSYPGILAFKLEYDAF